MRYLIYGGPWWICTQIGVWATDCVAAFGDDDDDGGLIKGLTGKSLSVYLFTQSPDWNASVSRSTRIYP